MNLIGKYVSISTNGKFTTDNCQVLFENILVEVYELLANALLKLHSNSCGINICLYDDVSEMLLIQFEVLSQPFHFY